MYFFALAPFAFGAQADESKPEFYLTAMGGNSTIEFLGAKTESQSTSYGIKLGYKFPIASSVDMAVELEYAGLGNLQYRYWESDGYMDIDLDARYTSFNLKYLTHLFDTGLYLGTQFGAGYYYQKLSMDFSVDSGVNDTYGNDLYLVGKGEKKSQGVGFSYGFELGYDLSDSWTVMTNYVISRVSLDDITYDYRTWMAGIQYRF